MVSEWPRFKGQWHVNQLSACVKALCTTHNLGPALFSSASSLFISPAAKAMAVSAMPYQARKATKPKIHLKDARASRHALRKIAKNLNIDFVLLQDSVLSLRF